VGLTPLACAFEMLGARGSAAPRAHTTETVPIKRRAELITGPSHGLGNMLVVLLYFRVAFLSVMSFIKCD
jgi:hypothetical protein